MDRNITAGMPKLIDTSKVLLVLCAIYMFLSYFEIYLPGISGSSTRYLIFVLSLMFLYQYHWKVRRTTYIIFIFLWFVYKVVSITWSNQSNNDVSRTILSQIGMILLFTAMCGQVHDKKLLRTVLQVNYWSSFLFGLLTLVFHRSYISEVFEARQVLTLFGKQNDPNNCAAFLVIGIAIAAYSLVSEKRMKVVNIVLILVNSYSIILTGSRMGFLLLGLIASVLLLTPNYKDKFIAGSFIKKAIAMLIILTVGIWIINRFLPAASLARMLAFDEYSEGSGRTVKWTLALERVLRERPIFGWGWGGYSFVDSVLHNTFLTILCDGGIVGLLLFIIPIGKLSYRLTTRKYQLGLMVLLTGIVSAFFLDAINKRFFWNTLIIAVMMLENYEMTGAIINVWPPKDELQLQET